ncbi:SEC-C domain-containing protein [Halotalea alkalilenta]|uniref:Zinc chelation protein SecC n=1 Tax=Halotalea alkalilenta TaxID=376489 RepID=A0A172YFZ7_9GAMM|nr:SEC-C domain-containing protein [Halotalea alkalilenta]ANF57992.1 zinc chelation protein SecC [Halotalea alkalilenta]
MLAAWVDHLLGYASGALSAVRRDERYPSLMRWARREGAELLGGDLALAQALAPPLWNQTPLLRLDFACEPLAPPALDEPCWCDSGHPYRRCCATVAFPGGVPAHLMWMLSLCQWRGPRLRAALERELAPDQALLEAGVIAAESGQLGRAQLLLEALFARADNVPAPVQSEYAFERLAELYQERGFHRKQAALIDSALGHGPAFLRGAALERLVLAHLESDDLESARDAFMRALRTIPDAPVLAYLETMLLLQEGQQEKARQRADFWYRRLLRSSDVDPAELGFVHELAVDPAGTLAEELISSDEELALPLSRLRSTLARLPSALPPTLVANQAGRLEYLPSKLDGAYYTAWSSQLGPADPEQDGINDLWHNASDWLLALSEHPEWLSSPLVLQELAMALSSRFGSLPWMVEPFFAPLAKRLESWLGGIERQGRQFLWEEGDNQAIYLFGLSLVVGMERGDRQRSRRIAERLLKLDGEDNLGLRELVLEQLLREGRDLDALALTETSDAESADWLGLYLGRALALYRLGRQAEAAELIRRVQRANRHMINLMLQSRPRPESFDQALARPGSRAQAWQYRVLLRERWMETPGAIAWLRQFVQPRG